MEVPRIKRVSHLVLMPNQNPTEIYVRIYLSTKYFQALDSPAHLVHQEVEELMEVLDHQDLLVPKEKLEKEVGNSL